MYELSANNDNVILYDKRNKRHFVLDSDDVDQIVDNNNKLKSDEIIEKYLKFKTEPIVVEKRLKTADLKKEYEDAEKLYKPKYATEYINEFLNKWKLSKEELIRLQIFPDEKTINEFERPQSDRDNMARDFKTMMKKLKEDKERVKTDPFNYVKSYIFTKISESSPEYMDNHFDDLKNRPWIHADRRYVNEDEINRLKKYKEKKGKIFIKDIIKICHNPVFDGVDFKNLYKIMKAFCMIWNTFYSGVQDNDYNITFHPNDRGEIRNKKPFSDEQDYINIKALILYFKNPDNTTKIEKVNIGFSFKNKVLVSLFDEFENTIFPSNDDKAVEKIWNLLTGIGYYSIFKILNENTVNNPFNIIFKVLYSKNSNIDDKNYFSRDNVVLKMYVENEEIKTDYIKKDINFMSSKVFTDFLDYIKKIIKVSTDKEEAIDLIINVSNDESSSSTTSSDEEKSQQQTPRYEIETNEIIKEDEEEHETVSSTTSSDGEYEPKPTTQQNNELNELLKSSSDEENKNLYNKLMDKIDYKARDTSYNKKSLSEKEIDDIKAKIRYDYEQRVHTLKEDENVVYNKLSKKIDKLINDKRKGKGRTMLYGNGWTDKTLTRIDNLKELLRTGSGYGRTMLYGYGWTDKTLTRIDNLKELLNN